MQKHFPMISLAALTATGMFFFACTREDNRSGAAPISSPADDGKSVPTVDNLTKAIIALKAKHPDPDELEARLQEIVALYGVPSGAHRVPGPVDATQADENHAPAPLGKSAAAQASRWFIAKSVTFGSDTTHTTMSRSMTIRAGCTVTLSTSHDRAVSNADPYVVMFSAPLANQNFSKVTILGTNDDADANLDANLVWTNTTGLDQWVTFIAHAYAPAVTGSGSMTIVCKKADGHLCGNYYTFGYIGGIVIRKNTESRPGGCTGPTATNISLTGNAATTHPAVLAVNRGTMRGGYIYGANTGSLLLDDMLANSNGNYFLAFTDQFNPSAANAGFQGDKYTCP